MCIYVIGTRGFPGIEGGVEKHCEELYPLIARKYEVVVYRRRPYVRSDCNYNGVIFKDLPSTTIKGIEAFFHSFISTLDAVRNHAQIIHYHNIGPGFFSWIAKRRNIPVVLTYHSANYEHDKWGIIEKRLLKLFESVALKNADYIIFVNKFQRKKYSAAVQEKSRYIPNGILGFPQCEVAAATTYLHSLGLQPNKYVLSVGRITPEKGFDTLISAFSNIKNEKGFKLVIVGGVEGETKYKKDLDCLANGGSVVFTGQLQGEQLIHLYQNAALYVAASRNEGFPISLLEAMSCGLEIVASDIPGMHVVKLPHENYFPVDDVVALSKLIERKLTSIERRQYDLQEFEWGKISEETLGIYDMLLNQNDDE